MIVNTENQVEGLAPEELNENTAVAEESNDVQETSTTDVSVDPDPPVNKEKVYSYLVSLYDNAGKKYNEQKLRQISSTSDVRYWVNWAHEKTGQKALDDNSWKKLSSTWVDQVKVEKKNQVQTLKNSLQENAIVPTAGDTDSQSILETTPLTSDSQEPTSLSDIPQPRVTEYYTEQLDENNSILPVIKQLPRDILTMGEGDAALAFNNILGDFGYNAMETEAGSNSLKVSRPDGSIFEINLMSDLGDVVYGAVRGDDFNQSLNLKHNKFVMDLALGKQNLVQVMSDQLDSNPFGINEGMRLFTRHMNKPEESDLAFLSKALTGEENATLFNTGGTFNPELFMTALQQLKGNISPAYNDIINQEADYQRDVRMSTLASVKTDNLVLPENPQTSLSEQEIASNNRVKSTYNKIDEIIKKYETSKRNTSKLLGKALKRSAALGQVDLHDEEIIGGLVNSGLDMLDMPLPSLMINDKQASFQDVYDLISTPKTLGYIQRGDIKVSIDDTVDVGLFNELVGKLKTTQERNTAFLDEGNPRLNSFLRGLVDVPQGIYAHTLDILNNFGVGISDSFQALGMSREAADYAVFGEFGVVVGGSKFSPPMAITKLSLPSKKDVEDAMALLPEYSGSISDSRGMGEFLSYGMQGFTASVPYIGAFIANPTVGLGVTFGSTYGGSIEEVRDAKDAAKQAQVSGAILTEKEKGLLGMSNNEARAYAFSKAGIETAITAAFTGRYFKQLKLANGFKNIPKTQESAQQLADAFARQNRKGLIATFSKYTGLDGRVIASEIPEEQFIAYTGYLTQVAFGLEEYDSKQALKLAKDAGLNSLFSSSAMSVGGKLITPNANEIANKTINRKITLDGEMDAVKDKLQSDFIISELESSGVSKNTPKFKAALQMQQDADNRILNIQKRKEELVEQMSVSDKKNFLQGIADLEGFQATMEEGGKPEEINATQKLIDEKKAKMRKLLTKYPSELSYYFLPKDTQTQLIDRALTELSEEAGPEETFSLTSEDSKVIERASQIYKEDVLERMVEPEENLDVSGYFNNVSDYYAETTQPAEADFDVDAAILEIEQKRKDGVELTSLEAEAEAKMLNDAQALDDSPPLTGFAEDGTPLNIELDDDKGQVISPKRDDGNFFFSPLSSDIKQDDITRTNTIISRIKSLNLSKGLYNSLDDRQKKILSGFLTDVKNGKRPKYARLETILDAQETINDLKVLNNNSPISILDNPNAGLLKDKKPVDFVKDLYPYLNNLGRKIMMGGTKLNPKNLMTSDIFLGAIFRNTSKGKPFIDLVSSANRGVATSINSSQEFINQDSSLFINEIKAYNKANPKSKISTDLRNLETSYEMQVLAHLRRRSGEIDQTTGLDTEFQRQKTSLLKELELRKQEYEKDKSDSTKEVLYRQLEDTLNRLGVTNALSYDDVTKNAKDPIVNALNRLSDRFPHAEAKKRKQDYDGQDTYFVDGTYVPSFRRGDDGNDRSDGSNKGGSSNYGTIAGVFQDIVMDDTLENSRLSFGNYFERAYQQMQGSFIDMNSRSDFEQIDMIVNSAEFEGLFKDTKEYEMVKKYFGSRMEVFNFMISQGQNVNVDFGSMNKVVLNPLKMKKAGAAFYSTLSAIGLARLNQPASQFYSATSGTIPMLTDARAKNHLQLANARFLYSMAGVGNGQKTAKYAQWANNLIGGGHLTNIYKQSRTGLRNALKAEFAIGDKTKLPLDYYVSKFNLDSSIFSDEMRGMKYTVDSFLDIVTKTSELSLEFFLANADRAAANSAFEAHYLQNRIDQGAVIPKDIGAWWAKENENPNKEAIEYADRRIAETMRQTEPTSEAEFYAVNASDKTKFAQRTVFPWGKFMLNAKANFANQYARSIDKTLPEVQREEARRRMQGIVNEVSVFNGIKLTTNSVTTMGIIGGIVSLLGTDEDDIKRYEGGMTKLISDALNIEDADYAESLSDMPRAQRETLEGFKNAMRESTSGLDNTLLEIYKHSMEYENKFEISKNYSVLVQTAFDVLQNISAIPAPEPLYDLAYMAMNEIYGDEIIPEYISADLERMGADSDEVALLVKENLGMYGVAFEQYDKWRKARILYNEGVFRKGKSGVGSGEIIEYIAADTPALQEKLDKTIKFMYHARTMNLLLPGPKGDMNKLLNKLERQIEENYTRSAPSIKGINNEFFKAYLDFRVNEQGITVDKLKIAKWWEKEQKNMNGAARKHAIEKIEEIRKASLSN